MKKSECEGCAEVIINSSQGHKTFLVGGVGNHTGARVYHNNDRSFGKSVLFQETMIASLLKGMMGIMTMMKNISHILSLRLQS